MATIKSDTKASGLAKKFKSLRRASKLWLQGVSESSKSLPGIPQPPLPHLLRSNIPPTDTEASLIRDVITTAEAAESRLKEMASSRNGSEPLSSHTARKLNCEIDRTHQFIVKHKATLSPIRRIPPELLQSIFIHALPMTIKDSIPCTRVFCVSQLPWALSQVCQLWRITMLSFSVMWRDLPLIDLKKDYTKEKPYLDFLAEMLKRSHNTSIRLVIIGQGNEHMDHPAIDMLVLHSDRWQEIKIHARLDLLPFFRNIKGRLSSLQSLSLCLYSTGITYPMLNYPAHDLFWIAPHLQHVELTGPTSQFIFPTHQFVYYCQKSGSLYQVVQMTSSSPSLRVLRLCSTEHGGPNTLPMTALRLPDLAILNTCFDELSHEPFFNNLTSPAIEELYVTTHGENSITPICSMILRSDSPCLLRVLHLQVQFAPGELPILLRLTPLITDLLIALPPAQDIFALIFDGNTPPLVPLLDECEFAMYFDSPSTEAIQALQLLASSRYELPDNATSTETLLSGEFHPLQTLRISLGFRSSSCRWRFEGWVHSNMSDELHKQRERLLAMLPELDYRRIPFKRKFDLKWKNKVTNLLTHIEALKIEKASDICVSVHSAFYNWCLPS